MKQYHDCLKYVYENGIDKMDRTGTGTRSVFGYDMRFNLKDGFPAITTKKLLWNAVVHELLWFIKGDTNIKYLTDNNVNIWNGWATESGDLGPVYGKMWRSWPKTDGGTIDQLKEVIDQLKHNPDSRRMIVSAWNPEFLPDPMLSPKVNAEIGMQALPPCHTLFQFYSAEHRDGKRYLSCKLVQRSADLFLGIPFNIASYALLAHLVAQITNHHVGDLIMSLGDAHIYSNHFDQVQEQLKREPYPLPTLELNKNIKNIDDFTFDDIKLVNYKHHPFIKANVSI